MKQFRISAAIWCCIIAWTSSSIAQSKFEYVPVKDDSLQLLSVKNVIKQHYLSDSAALEGDYKKQMVKIYRERYDYLQEMFTHNELMANAAADDYLNSLTTEIIKNNPLLKPLGSHFHFSKVYWPNATSHGEGTIVFNLGLFAKLNTESEVVFVLCHELSHLYFDHSNKGVRQYVNTVNSEEFLQELKDIKKSKYEKNKQLDKLEKGIVFKSRRHGRMFESQADSMALVFMQNTRFNLNGALTCLGLLDEIDKDTYDTEKGLPALFNSTEYPFRTTWTRPEETLFGAMAEKKLTSKEEDSLKTHPDCKARIEKLKLIIARTVVTPGADFVIDQDRFRSLKQRFSFDIVEFCFTSKRVSRCLYYSMELLNTYPGNPYLVTMVGKCFNSFYENQTKHTLNQVVDLPSPYQEKNYNTLLRFLQNIRINEIAAIGFNFLKKYKEECGAYGDFKLIFDKTKANFEKK